MELFCCIFPEVLSGMRHVPQKSTVHGSSDPLGLNYRYNEICVCKFIFLSSNDLDVSFQNKYRCLSFDTIPRIMKVVYLPQLSCCISKLLYITQTIPLESFRSLVAITPISDKVNNLGVLTLNTKESRKPMDSKSVG